MSTLTKVITVMVCVILTAALAYCVVISLYNTHKTPAILTRTDTITSTEIISQGKTDSLKTVTLKHGKIKRKLPSAGKDSSITLTITDTTGLTQSILLPPAPDSITIEYTFPFENILPVRTDTLVRTVITSSFREQPVYNTGWFGAVCGIAVTLLLFLAFGK